MNMAFNQLANSSFIVLHPGSNLAAFINIIIFFIAFSR